MSELNNLKIKGKRKKRKRESRREFKEKRAGKRENRKTLTGISHFCIEDGKTKKAIN